MSAPELPSELTGHMATLRGECDAHAKARAVAAKSSGKAHLAAVMGNALSRQLGKDSDWDVADFVKQHKALAKFCENWEKLPLKSLHRIGHDIDPKECLHWDPRNSVGTMDGHLQKCFQLQNKTFATDLMNAIDQSSSSG